MASPAGRKSAPSRRKIRARTPSTLKAALRRSEQLTRGIIDSLAAHVAVLDSEGRIVMTNDAWNRFARENSPGRPHRTGIGVNYLNICRSACGGESAEGAEDILGGLTPPTSGTVHINGQDLMALSDAGRTALRRFTVGFVFQKYNLLPTLSAADNIAMARHISGKPETYDDWFHEVLGLLGIEQRLHHKPRALSGGEQQRVAIARALLNDPAIILADEPTGNLDSRQSVEIWTLLRRIAREQGKTILMVTHEAHGAAFADRVIVLKDGRIVGTLEPKGAADAALVAGGYQELAG